jgi:hypothetical protein
MRDELIDMLKSAGVDDQSASLHAEGFLRENQQNDSLEKSLDALADVARAQADAERDAEERLSKAWNDGSDASWEILAPALDSLLTEQREQNEALSKGLKGVLELFSSLKEDISALRPQPQAPVALAKSLDFVPSPREENSAQISRDELFKALSTNASENPDKAGEMIQAVALLEAGETLENIQARYL